MVINELQQQLFNHIKASLPVHMSLADELCCLLNISPDSAYRRIRGEKPITLTELKTICEKYQLSLDQLLQLQTDTVVFKASDLKKRSFPFADILGNMLMQLKYFNSFKDKTLLYLCKDMPFWQFFLYPELAAFKIFFWAKTLHNEPEYANRQFALDEIDYSDFIKTGKELLGLYNQIPSVELWNLESINSTTSQIKFYKESGVFKKERDIEMVVNSFQNTLNHLQIQAERNTKFLPGDSDLLYKAPVQLYVNEVVIGSNTILAELDGAKVSFIPYNVFSFLFTRDVTFNESVFDGFNRLRSRSTLISGTGEKERSKFFSTMRTRLNELR